MLKSPGLHIKYFLLIDWLLFAPLIFFFEHVELVLVLIDPRFSVVQIQEHRIQREVHTIHY